jgi:hypothetical protein
MKGRSASRCLNCGASVRQPKRGRPKLYCSASCRQRAYERRLREPATEALKRDLAEHDRQRADRAEAEAAELRRQLAEIRGLPETDK